MKAATMTVSEREAPCPPSPVVKGLTWAPPESIERRVLGPYISSWGRKDGSDNWPVTWADDGEIYTTYGDGYGFDPIIDHKLGMGVARVRGWARSFVGENVRSDIENDKHGESGKKGHGILCVGGVLYLWAFHADNRGGGSLLAVSHDKGVHWTYQDWAFLEFGLCGFVNYGRDYEGARDEYVYSYSHDGALGRLPADRFVMMRVPKDRICERDAYEFFVSRDADGGARWTRDVGEAGAVFEHPDACGRSAMTYNPYVKRYFWWQQVHNPADVKDRADTRFEGGFGIYDAPEPWGPWTTVYFTPKWDVGPGEHGDFPAKWMSEDGQSMYLVFSGDDNFCVREARLERY